MIKYIKEHLYFDYGTKNLSFNFVPTILFYKEPICLSKIDKRDYLIRLELMFFRVYINISYMRYYD